jgi:hypothetical protein
MGSSFVLRHIRFRPKNIPPLVLIDATNVAFQEKHFLGCSGIVRR